MIRPSLQRCCIIFFFTQLSVSLSARNKQNKAKQKRLGTRHYKDLTIVMRTNMETDNWVVR